MTEPIHIISLGAGVQSSTMALKATKREIVPMPVAGVIADTKWERFATYVWLRWLCGCEILEFAPGRWCAKEGIWNTGVLAFPIHVISAGDLRADQISKTTGTRAASLPYYTSGNHNANEGRMPRQCTYEYKIAPIEEWMKREILKIPRKGRLPQSTAIIQWRGISTDEVSRVKPSSKTWYENRHPLALELGLSRNDCQRWILEHYRMIAPRSSCIGCPHHGSIEWRSIKSTPAEWDDAVAFDKSVRSIKGVREEVFLHRSCKPLSEVDFSTEEERGQLNMFNNECEGMCGV